MTYSNFVNNQQSHYKVIKRKVMNDTYNFTPYKEKLILKSRDSLPRLISIPTLRDKLTLKSLQLVLSNTFSNVKQPLPQKCIQEIKSSIHKYDQYIKLDLTNYYGTIKHGILFSILKAKIKKEEILSLIRKAITTPTVLNGPALEEEMITEGIPQGLSISNILSNIYLHKVDDKFGNRNDLKYIRYGDDILILCTEKNVNSVYSEIKYELEGIYNLTLNSAKEKKGKISKKSFNFLGYSVEKFEDGTTKLTVRDENKERLENSIIKIFTKYKYSDKMSPEQFLFALNNKITGSISTKIDGDETKEYRYGWLFYFSQIEDTSFLYHLDWFIKILLQKFNFKQISRSKIKSFVKAFYEIKYKYRDSKYIHRPDNLTFVEKGSY